MADLLLGAFRCRERDDHGQHGTAEGRCHILLRILLVTLRAEIRTAEFGVHESSHNGFDDFEQAALGKN